MMFSSSGVLESASIGGVWRRATLLLRISVAGVAACKRCYRTWLVLAIPGGEAVEKQTKKKNGAADVQLPNFGAAIFNSI